jgi:hypothetical protein
VADEPGNSLEEASLYRTAVVVENHGRLPVTDVVLHTVHDDTDGTVMTPGWPNPIVVRYTEDGHAFCSVLGPGSRYESPWVVLDYRSMADPQEIRVDISFVDAEGLRWRRIGNEHPRRMTASFQDFLDSERYPLDRRGRWRFKLARRRSRA